MDERTVFLHRASVARYPVAAPFHPDNAYPEYEMGSGAVAAENFVYRGVRDLLQRSGLDAGRYGRREWNPLGEFIRPGQSVILKPNMIKESHPRDPEGWRYILTHGSMVRAVADYVWKALQGRGRIIVADAPQTDSSFERMTRLLGLDVIRDFYAARGLDLDLVDLRREEWKEEGGVIVARRPLAGDPNGYVAINLGNRSEFADHAGGGRYYGADYDAGEVNRHHIGGRHEYLISGSVIGCDALINLPKLKTHKKAGITVNLKNLVGVNGDKNWLPHHTVGFPDNGGDQYPAATMRRRIERHAVALLHRAAVVAPELGASLLRRARRSGTSVFGETSRVIRSGNWYGNDTIWRMCLDLNKAVLYANPDGTLRDPDLSRRKTILCFVDGMIAGQGNGPIDADPAPMGTLLFATNPASCDAVAAVLMGFDAQKIPIVREAFRTRGFPLTAWDWCDVRCASNDPKWTGACGSLPTSPERPRFTPHFGWTGHIEAGTS